MDFLTSVKKKKKLSKVVIVGSGAVGKTSLLKVLKSGKLLDQLNVQYHRTLFMEFESLHIEEKSILLLDVAGQMDLPVHALKDFERLSLGGADLVVLMFAADSMQSFLDLEKWFKLVKMYYEGQNLEPPLFVALQNKIDLESNVSTDMLEMVKNGVPEIVRWFNLSLKTGEGLVDFVEYLTGFNGE